MKLGRFVTKIENYTTEQVVEVPIGCDAEITAVYVTHKNTFSTAQEIEVYSTYGVDHIATELIDTCTKRYTIRPVALTYNRTSNAYGTGESQQVFIRLANALGETQTSYITVIYDIAK